MPRALIRPHKDFRDATPQLALAVAHLYGNPALYDQYRLKINQLLGVIYEKEPLPCKMQDQISELFPNIDNLRLYVGISIRRDPDYYISIKRVDGLWRLVSKRKSEVKSHKMHSGVLFTPDVPFGMPILGSNVDYNLSRVLTGGSAITTFAGDLEDYEVRRQVSQCAAAAWWFGALGKEPNYQLSVKVGNRGRVILGIQQSDIPENAFIEPWPFVPIRDRKYYDAKAKFSVLGDIIDHTLPINHDFRCVLPHTAGLADWEDSDRPMGGRTKYIIAELLRNRVIPLVGYRIGSWCSVYGLGYDPKINDYAIQVFAARRRAADLDASIPIIERDEHHSMIKTNGLLTHCMAQTLVAPDETEAAKQRIESVRRCLAKLLRDTDSASLNAWYTEYGVRLNEAKELIPGGFTRDERVILEGRLDG